MKQEISSAPMLAYYNPKKQTVLQTDISIKDLVTCLLPEEKPVYFACKGLTEAQKGYVAIEIELLTSGLDNGEILSLFICQSFYLRN